MYNIMTSSTNNIQRLSLFGLIYTQHSNSIQATNSHTPIDNKESSNFLRLFLSTV